jgi:hypothetical protein
MSHLDYKAELKRTLEASREYTRLAIEWLDENDNVFPVDSDKKREKHEIVSERIEWAKDFLERTSYWFDQFKREELVKIANRETRDERYAREDKEDNG